MGRRRRASSGRPWNSAPPAQHIAHRYTTTMPASVRQRSERTLRVFVDAPLDMQRDYAWALFDSTQRSVETGRGKPAAWPHADRREAVLGADGVRLVALTLPPLQRER